MTPPCAAVAPCEIWGEFAVELAPARRLPESLGQFATPVRLKPDFAKAHHNLGAVLLRSGRATEAIAEFEAALRINPAHADARRNLEVAKKTPAP